MVDKNNMYKKIKIKSKKKFEIRIIKEIFVFSVINSVLLFPSSLGNVSNSISFKLKDSLHSTVVTTWTSVEVNL